MSHLCTRLKWNEEELFQNRTPHVFVNIIQIYVQTLPVHSHVWHPLQSRLSGKVWSSTPARKVSFSSCILSMDLSRIPKILFSFWWFTEKIQNMIVKQI